MDVDQHTSFRVPRPVARVSSLKARTHENETSIPNHDLSVLSHVAMVPSPEARVSSHDFRVPSLKP